MSNQARDAIIRKIRAALSEQQPVFQLTASIKTSVKYPDGSYKTKPLDPNDELIMVDIRDGKSGFIFEFTPMEPKPYAGVEISREALFETVRGFEPWIVAALGFSYDATVVDDEVVDGVDWKKAVKTFIADFVEREKETAFATNAHNPEWGIF